MTYAAATVMNGGGVDRWRAEVGCNVLNVPQELTDFIDQAELAVELLRTDGAFQYVVDAAHEEWNRRHGIPVDEDEDRRRNNFTASYILQELEDAELHRLENWLGELGWEFGGRFFDGLCVQPRRVDVPSGGGGRPGTPEDLVRTLNARYSAARSSMKVAVKQWRPVPGLEPNADEQPARQTPTTHLPGTHPHITALNVMLAQHLRDSTSAYTSSTVSPSGVASHRYPKTANSPGPEHQTTTPNTRQPECLKITSSSQHVIPAVIDRPVL
jgi:hypothetical protein